MPKPPTCRKCGNPHWSTERCPRVEKVEGHLIPFEPLEVTPPLARDEILMSPEAYAILAGKQTSCAKGRDRKACMREFMAKKRAKPK